ncbi:uncharacterized protein LOC123515561 [Portunus trituberculatus]|uniref:uncharacterized protein LOC123515561 n=1 Tax=Portunus trituberculatus TaxID=210409 RepID=UPI001E1CFE63|nr:uncharacterized protein LOC123515561 [Portunus trituberculatus]
MILDQFLTSLNPDISTFIKECRPLSLAQAVQLDDDWASAHYTSKPSFRSSSRSFKPPLKETPPVQSSPSPTSSTTRCHGCGELGHIRPRCPKNPRAFKESPPSQPFTVEFCLSDHSVPQPLVSGTVNGSWTSSILRDTGCSCIVVAEVVLTDVDSNCRSCQVADYLGRVDTFPIVQCYISCPYFEGWTDTIRAPFKFASVLIGNVPGVHTPKEPYPTFSYDELVSVPGFSSASAVTLPVQSFQKPSSAFQDSLPPVTSSVSQDSLPPVTSSFSQDSLPPVTSSVSQNSLPPVTSSVSQDSLPPVTSSVCAVETRASTTMMKRLHHFISRISSLCLSLLRNLAIFRRPVIL